MSIPAHLTVDGSDGQRVSRRRRIRLAAGRVDADYDPRDIVIHDLSVGGCSFVSHRPIAPGVRIRLRIPHAGEVAARTSWAQGARIGCAFDRPLSREALAAALAESQVIWGDFGMPEPTPPAAIAPARGARWPARTATVLIGVALLGFWIAVAAIV